MSFPYSLAATSTRFASLPPDAAPSGTYGLPDKRPTARSHALGSSRVGNELRSDPRPSQFTDRNPSRILVRRWKDDIGDGHEHEIFGDPDCIIVVIALRPTDATFTVDGRQMHDGRVFAGMVLMTPGRQRTTVQFRSPCDMLHLLVPADRLRRVSQEAGEAEATDPVDRPSLKPSDHVIERLAWLFFKAGEFQPKCAELYMDGIALAIMARLLNARADCGEAGTQGLIGWRLKRVQDLVEAGLSEPLSLSDLARSAGLSRMHFAAQFRAATGMRPHEYVVRRRIQRAQEILRTSDIPLVEVALTVGFQTQAHFTTVFRRLLSESPARWRLQQRSGGNGCSQLSTLTSVHSSLKGADPKDRAEPVM